jgi:hypothetical protein
MLIAGCVLEHIESIDVIYDGAIPFKALKHNSNNLYSILYFTGSQCSFFRIGVTCSVPLVLVISLAALF